MKLRLFAITAALTATLTLYGQVPNPTQTNQPAGAVEPSGGQPIFRVQVVARTIAAVSYRNRSGWTKIDFQGTALSPKSKGTAEANSRLGHLQVKVNVKDLQPATQFGPEYLTYVLWAITPDGRAENLGEVQLSGGGEAHVDATTDLQSFGLILTAEPYFAVTQPSDVVVMENIIRQDTVGKIEEVDAKYELLQRGQYTKQAHLTPMVLDPKVPIELYEARNAVQLAKLAGADQYGGSTYNDSVTLLNQAEAYEARKAGRKPVAMTARESAQKAEDSRIIAIKRQQQIALDTERADAAAREAKAKADADAALRQQQAAEEQARQDDLRRRQAEQDRAAAEQAKAQADAESARANAEALKAKQAAAEADALRAQADQLKNQALADKEALRRQLLEQFNAVLETRETVRGLVVNMNDVLFDSGKYTLKPGAREKLAKISGIIVSHPGLNLQVEGHTDSIGSDEYNQKLSEQRANTVRDYLTGAGIRPENVTAQGMGKGDPIASNDTPQGRQLNRRVELVVSGEIIGVKIGVAPAMPAAPANQ